MNRLDDVLIGECVSCNDEVRFKYIYSKVNGERIYFCMKCGENHPEGYFIGGENEINNRTN